MASCRIGRVPVNAENPAVIKHGAQRVVIADGADTRPGPKTFDEPPTGPWMARSEEVAGTGVAHCGPWVRSDSPQYRSIQVNVDHRGCNIVGDAANEPSIAIDPTDPRKIVIGWRQFDTIESDFRQAGWAYSHDAGHTWVFPGVLDPGVFGSDPVLAAGPTGTFYYLSMGSDLLRLFRSFDAGVTWETPLQVAPGYIDKPWVTVDCTMGVGRGNVYIQGTGLNLVRSTDGGASFSDPIDSITPRYPTMSLGVDGALYVAGGSERLALARLTNAPYPDQATVVDHTAEVAIGRRIFKDVPPNGFGLAGQLWVATDHSDAPTRGNVYVLGSVDLSDDSLLDVTFARSTDRGVTWSEKVRVNDDPEVNGAWQWFGTMSVAPNGRIDAIWNDTRNYTAAPWSNLCELYYSYSTDAGVTWSTNIPVSPMFDSYVGWPDNPKLGDYYHMISDNLGVNVAYAATFNGEQDVYFLRIGPWDCNGNEVPDECDLDCNSPACEPPVCEPGEACIGSAEYTGIADYLVSPACGVSLDCNANDVPDECEYRGDFDGDGLTTLRDFAAFQHCFTGTLGTSGGSSTWGIPGGSSKHGATGGLPASALAQDPCCRLFDLDPDNKVDLIDYEKLRRSLAGP